MSAGGGGYSMYIGIGGPGVMSDATGHRKRGYKRRVVKLRRFAKRMRSKSRRRGCDPRDAAAFVDDSDSSS